MSSSNSIIIVPYRNRAAHLAQFVRHMNKYYGELEICIVEQYEHKPFNRGKLLNVGFLENKEYSYVIFHDVDMVPVNVDYTIANGHEVVQLAKSDIQQFDYLGGVTKFNTEAFYRTGGYHNDYYHRAEDNEMMFNLKRLRINVIEKPQVFTMLHHERQGQEFDPALWLKAQKKRAIQNQLSSCLYSIANVQQFGNVKHITVAV